MSRYRKRPVEVDAFHLTDANHATTPSLWPDWMKNALRARRVEIDMACDEIYVTTLEGTLIAQVGDWIIRGLAGEIYPCRADIFEATYEAVDSAERQP